ncbi:MAG TPA: carboxypeptidase-like regulatory domain-containing protein [Vicinamibacterales bacterium]|nr:carboxypeptidase-like regulatory domain-containing protein [Vicinamibacterales bacterium]
MTVWPVVLLLTFLRGPVSAGQITGVVVDADTRAPVAGARVVLTATDPAASTAMVTLTDAQGSFHFAPASPGTYRVRVGGDGYLPLADAVSIVVVTDAAMKPLRLALTRASAIAGRVLTEFGDAAPAVIVRALAGDRTVAEARTNDLGDYRLFGLAPGEYRVAAERYAGPRVEGERYVVPTPPCPDCPGEGQFMRSVSSVTAGGEFVDPYLLLGQTHPTVYYAGTLDASTAAPVIVMAGADVGGIDLRLIAVRAN